MPNCFTTCQLLSCDNREAVILYTDRYSRVQLVKHLHNLLFDCFRCFASLWDDEAIKIRHDNPFVAVVSAVFERDKFRMFLLRRDLDDTAEGAADLNPCHVRSLRDLSQHVQVCLGDEQVTANRYIVSPTWRVTRGNMTISML